MFSVSSPLLHVIPFSGVGRPHSQPQGVLSVHKWQFSPHNIKYPVPPLWVTLHSLGQWGDGGRAASLGEKTGSSGGAWLLVSRGRGRGRGEEVSSTFSMWQEQGLESNSRSFRWSNMCSVFILRSPKTVRWSFTSLAWWMIAAINCQSRCRYPHM